MTSLPRSCVVRQRVEAALASGLEGNERPDAELWLEGYRRLTPTMLSLPDLQGLEVRFQEIGDSQRALLESLGVNILIDPKASPKFVFGNPDRDIRLRRDYVGRR